MNDPIVITRDKVKRGASDIEPKIAIAGVFAFLCIVALIVAGRLGIELPPEIAGAAAVTITLIAGYLTSSIGTVVTRTSDNEVVTESHSAPTVTTITSPVTIQPPATPSFTEALTGERQSDPNADTVRIPDPSPASAFMAARGLASRGSIDEH